ncbi:MAG TPA: urate hydroxylase PuuD, partial [Bacteroidota bacterium]
MDIVEIISVLSRWLHIGAGILWIGLLYFYNFVNAPFAATMDGDTKKKVVPELLPRSLFWFRWGAAFTWITGVLLLVLVFYHGEL